MQKIAGRIDDESDIFMKGSRSQIESLSTRSTSAFSLKGYFLPFIPSLHLFTPFMFCVSYFQPRHFDLHLFLRPTRTNALELYDFASRWRIHPQIAVSFLSAPDVESDCALLFAFFLTITYPILLDRKVDRSRRTLDAYPCFSVQMLRTVA